MHIILSFTASSHCDEIITFIKLRMVHRVMLKQYDCSDLQIMPFLVY